MSNKHRKELIRGLFTCRLNGYGAELWTTKEGGAVISFDRYLNTIRKHRIAFDTVEKAEEYIDSIPGFNDASKLNWLLKRAGIFRDNEDEWAA